MVTPVVREYHIERFWDDEFKTLDYIHEPFNDPASVALWNSQGYTSKICGDLCDMRHRLPAWSSKFVEMYEAHGWKDIGLAFYRMSTDTVMPVHQDLYKRYIELFNLQGQETSIRRALLLLEDWQPGHYLEVNSKPYGKLVTQLNGYMMHRTWQLTLVLKIVIHYKLLDTYDINS